MKTTLLIMAAGIGSRFGEGIKQLEPVGENNELIIDYSIHDAIEAGFNKIIFVIRKEIEQDFRERIGDRVEAVCKKLNVEVCYAYQDIHAIPVGCDFPEGRTKPWGTGQAVLSARNLIHEPFAVINADDYYGKKAFQKIYCYLNTAHKACCMAGFQLGNTLSDHGGVTRGLCTVRNCVLTDVVETKNIVNTPAGPEADGKILDPKSIVSMNMWGFPAEIGRDSAYLQLLSVGFRNFFKEMKNPLKDEFLLPIHIGSLLGCNLISVQVLETDDQWFGVTYREDREFVIQNFRKLIADGVYKSDLYSDLL